MEEPKSITRKDVKGTSKLGPSPSATKMLASTNQYLPLYEFKFPS